MYFCSYDSALSLSSPFQVSNPLVCLMGEESVVADFILMEIDNNGNLDYYIYKDPT